MTPIVICPGCGHQDSMDNVLTAQSNQNIIFCCEKCGLTVKDIETSKG